MEDVMNRKSLIIFVLAAVVVTGGLVFDGISRRHAANNSQAVSQTPAPSAPVTAVAENSSNTPNTNDSTAAPADAAATATDAGQSVTATDAAQAPADDNNAAPDTPQPIIIPAGTSLTVRLAEKLGSRISEPNQSFSATLDRDVVVGGQTVISAGANVTGKVVIARPAGALAGEATLQLKVISVNVNNNDMSIVTSVRSFGPKIKGQNKVGRFMKGLLKRAAGDEREVLLADQSAYSFTLRRQLQIE
jgi:hypothetical protein